MDLDRQREWDEAVRLHFYNQESELLLHGELFDINSRCVLGHTPHTIIMGYIPHHMGTPSSYN